MIEGDALVTGKDFERAAMIFQHRFDSSDYRIAVELMEEAVERDKYISKWLLAATTDRYLLSIGKPQIFGTQYERQNGEPWVQSDFDSLAVDDMERMRHGVPSLAEQKKQLAAMNKNLEN